jgi:tetratricopeptide (TPR) repeat protein
LTPLALQPARGPFARLFGALRAFFARLLGAPSPEARTRIAAERLTAALAEDDPERRVELLRDALASGEALSTEAAEVLVMEASLHLGEKLRAMGQRDEAMAHFARAVERSFRVGDPVGRQRRAGVLSRLGILDQEAGNAERACQRYREALELGSDTDSSLLLGMLTQAAFNLGLLDTDRGDEAAARASWERAIALGQRAGHPSGWDPAAVAAFNLGHLCARRGETARARELLEQAARIAEPSGTPIGLMAAAKSELALGGLEAEDGLAGEPEAVRHYARAVELGRASEAPEGAFAALQASLALGELAVGAGRYLEASGHYCEAMVQSGRSGPESARFGVLAELRVGQTLAEVGEREEAVIRLASAFERGRDSDDEWVRELAAQAACTRHRVLCALERWEEAGALADDAEGFAASLGSGTGKALAAAARYARAFQLVHHGDAERARPMLREVAEAGFASGSDVGERVALDALLLVGHLERQAGHQESALEAFRRVTARLRGHRSPDADGLAAMAEVNAGHCLLSLERGLEARFAYEKALECGRASGGPAGRAAAANAALNLASLLEDEAPRAKRRELCRIAIALGRSSGSSLGAACADTAERALERIGEGD